MTAPYFTTAGVCKCDLTGTIEVVKMWQYDGETRSATVDFYPPTKSPKEREEEIALMLDLYREKENLRRVRFPQFDNSAAILRHAPDALRHLVFHTPAWMLAEYYQQKRDRGTAWALADFAADEVRAKDRSAAMAETPADPRNVAERAYVEKGASVTWKRVQDEIQNANILLSRRVERTELDVATLTELVEKLPQFTQAANPASTMEGKNHG